VDSQAVVVAEEAEASEALVAGALAEEELAGVGNSNKIKIH
jgi:hypothetical protein